MKRIIGIAEMHASSVPEEEIVTYALGSCLGVAIYDPVAKVGGLLHAMLPLSTIDPGKAQQKPCMFVDTGVSRLFLECYRLGAKKERIVVKVAGGANIQNELKERFQVGKRNLITLRKLLWKNGVLIQAQDVGGHHSRTMSLSIATGDVVVRSNGDSKSL